MTRWPGSEWFALDPHVNFDVAAGWIRMDAYEGLISFDGEGRVIPGAAERWGSARTG